MKTPIYNFLKNYSSGGVSRFHMPGHKGKEFIGCESLDITEISGADVLYSAEGIIAQSEVNATALFDTAHTYYSTEGSTLCIKAMLKLATDRRKANTPRLIFAARGVHRSFISACALLDVNVEWIYPENACHVCDNAVSAEDIDAALGTARALPQAVYVTSPNYLGGVLDIEKIARACRKYGVPLIVDNAHGAYLKFLETDMHPITLGAAMCADSAHKTLPVLTPGAYLHVSKEFAEYTADARDALSLFASTSPSYLTLASLDLCNKYILDGYPQRLASCVMKIQSLKQKLLQNGIPVLDSEPLKIVIDARKYGYLGRQIAEELRLDGIEAEFADDAYAVLMVTPENTDGDLSRLSGALCRLKKRQEKVLKDAFKLTRPKAIMPIREAMLSPCERISVKFASGRILADAAVSCPPAVPIVISGEKITDAECELFSLHGIEYIKVVK